MKKLNSYIDHTNLKPEAQIDEIKTLVDEAVANDFYSVCVNSTYVKDIKAYNEDVRIAAVVGFPLGAMVTRAKTYEAKCAVEDGASEIDMVIPIGRLKDKDYAYVLSLIHI